MGSEYGECEQRVRDVFAAARRHGRAAVFVDELDAVAAARDQVPRARHVTPRHAMAGPPVHGGVRAPCSRAGLCCIAPGETRRCGGDWPSRIVY